MKRAGEVKLEGNQMSEGSYSNRDSADIIADEYMPTASP